MDKADNRKKTPFFSGLLWGSGSLIITALSGVIFIIFIMAFYDVETLGVFNQVYAYYIVFSQFSVLGIHISVRRYISDFHYSDESNAILAAGLYSTAICSIAVTGILGVLNTFHCFGVNLSVGIATILPALPFFSLNKVFLDYLNGLSKMKAFAIFQIIKSLGVAFFLLLLYFLKIGNAFICVSFTLCEIMLFILLLFYFIKTNQLKWSFSSKWTKHHIIFGIKAFPSNLIIELNNKIDIICLSWLLRDDTLIGFYSFATIFSGGFYQLFGVVRRNLNPHIMGFVSGEKSDLFTARNKRRLYFYAGALNLLLICGVYIISCMLNQYQAMVPLIIISLGVTVNAYYIVLMNAFSQTGKPEKESLINSVTLLSNLILNLFLIKNLGIAGAAVATAVSYLIFSLLSRSYFKKYQMPF